MTDDPFLHAIIENPGDDTLRLVYADWLEERGDPRAPFVRAHPEIYQFIAALKRAVTSAPFVLNQFAAPEQADLLFGVALVLEPFRQDLHFNPRVPGIVQGALEYIERSLALAPGLPNVEALLKRLAAGPVPPPQSRVFASLLASGQSADVLLTALGEHEQENHLGELLACLVQEMVLRGARLEGQPGVARLAKSMRARNHPLAALPLSLLDVEAEVGACLPRYTTTTGSSWPTPSSLSWDAVSPLSLGTAGRPPTTSEAMDTSCSTRMGSAVLNWEEESNGLVEARAFRFDRSLATEEVTVGMLQSLGLESLRGAAGANIRAERVRLQDAFNALFSAASTGGAYNGGLAGAYGRLAAWQSMAGLAGAPNEELIEEVAGVARRCSWVSYHATSGWFCNIAWDLGLVCVRPDGMSLAVLAATDTD
jgi:uncharacterized protein (TIGR02996 family)